MCIHSFLVHIWKYICVASYHCIQTKILLPLGDIYIMKYIAHSNMKFPIFLFIPSDKTESTEWLSSGHRKWVPKGLSCLESLIFRLCSEELYLSLEISEERSLGIDGTEGSVWRELCPCDLLPSLTKATLLLLDLHARGLWNVWPKDHSPLLTERILTSF